MANNMDALTSSLIVSGEEARTMLRETCFMAREDCEGVRFRCCV